ncbi:hypothetical protein SAMN05661080_02207 [Modestobacter sp. DSM 44400]|uniref:hypothetical protein n=1 Tax=Modestobacter sp. DSM 44400 TaxID=1550230 RepID=UPI00089C4610|nr:hypothetical protein [Modestobacter sp. DSM 44400]SDY07240.1 hypothetical protein SAMN05661080_02207 [Modestobacter sp. DSM 44400]
MTDLILILGTMVLAVLLAVVTGSWLVWRRIRRSHALALAREAAGYGSMAVTAWRLRSSPDRSTAALALRISRAHARLRQEVTVAERAGAHLGNVPALLPRLQVAGVRIGAGLRHVAVVPAVSAPRLLDEARTHLSTLEDLSDAVRTATLTSAADGTLAQDAEDAALALRCRTAAYEELVALADSLVRPRG